jgi:hypothetical protein
LRSFFALFFDAMLFLLPSDCPMGVESLVSQPICGQRREELPSVHDSL